MAYRDNTKDYGPIADFIRRAMTDDKGLFQGGEKDRVFGRVRDFLDKWGGIGKQMPKLPRSPKKSNPVNNPQSARSAPKVKPPISVVPDLSSSKPLTRLIQSMIALGLGKNAEGIIDYAMENAPQPLPHKGSGMYQRNEFGSFEGEITEKNTGHYATDVDRAPGGGKYPQQTGQTIYDNRGVDAPMTTQTGQATYDMARRGVEGEVINRPPMTGDRTTNTYDMRTDSPGVGYVNIGGQIYKKGTEPQEYNNPQTGLYNESEHNPNSRPAISSIRTEDKPQPDTRRYTNQNDLENIQTHGEDDVKWRADSESERIINEVLNEDFNIIGEESRNFNPKSSIEY